VQTQPSAPSRRYWLKEESVVNEDKANEKFFPVENNSRLTTAASVAEKSVWNAACSCQGV
jgi:hypothetical protein